MPVTKKPTTVDDFMQTPMVKTALIEAKKQPLKERKLLAACFRKMAVEVIKPHARRIIRGVTRG